MRTVRERLQDKWESIRERYREAGIAVDRE